MTLELWPFQAEAVDAVGRTFGSGVKRTLVSMPTGTGKSVLMVFWVHMALRQGNRVLIVVPTTEIKDQIATRLASTAVHVGIVMQDQDDWREKVVVATIQTISRPNRLVGIPPDAFDMIIVDEAHLANASSYQRLFKHFHDAWYVGLTATPFRGDKESLSLAGWNSVSYVYSIADAIADGYLARPVAYRVRTDLELDSVPARTPKEGGERDFSQKKLAAKVNTPARNRAIVRAYADWTMDRSAVAFCSSVAHAKALMTEFRQNGVDARYISHEMGLKQRESILYLHQQGVFQVLCNCAVLTHGYDDPDLEGIIMARPTLSKVLFVQMAGRAMRRLTPEKTSCFILDVVDACKRHRLAVTREVLDLEMEMEPGETRDVRISEPD